MPSPLFGCRVRLAAFTLMLLAALADGQTPAGDELLTEAEIVALGRENAMWRLANPDEGLAANVARLRQAGYTEEEIAALQPRLAAMWSVPFERNFGWLRPETVERIRVIDREFVGRMRAAQLYERTGVQVKDSGRESIVSLNRQWRVALVHALANDELAEFQLTNSTSARQETRLARGLRLTADEQRTLFEWRRDYEGRRGAPLATESGLTEWQREMFLDQCRRIRDLLGDARFAVYLSRANPGFERMRSTLDRLGETNPSVMLDLWWLRQKDAVTIARRTGLTMPERTALMLRMRERAVGLMGEARMTVYAEDDDGRWLSNTPRKRLPRKPRPDSATAP